MPKKTQILTEPEIAKTYVIAKGFNIETKEGERRFEPGVDNPAFVSKEDFAREVWEELIDTGAITKFDDPTTAKQGEMIAAEIVE